MIWFSGGEFFASLRSAERTQMLGALNHRELWKNYFLKFSHLWRK